MLSKIPYYHLLSHFHYANVETKRKKPNTDSSLRTGVLPLLNSYHIPGTLLGKMYHGQKQAVPVTSL